MILKLAWRNLWRSRIRSLIVIFATAIGVWAGVFMVAYAWGMYDYRIRTAIEKEVSHIQIHQKTYQEDEEIKFSIAGDHSILSELKNDEQVKAFSPRWVNMAMITKSGMTNGIKLIAIDTTLEQQTTGLADKLVEGKYFSGTRSRPMVLSQRMAKKLKARKGSKVVVSFPDAQNDIHKIAFRVVGIYNTNNAMYDELNVFVLQSSINKELAQENTYHEIALLLNDREQIEPVMEKYSKAYPEMAVEDWGAILPEYKMAIDNFDINMGIIVGIMMLAVGLGVLNTMLMAVMERTREIGMLKAVGMRGGRIFRMIMSESFIMVMIGALVGFLLGKMTVNYLGTVGLDMAVFGEAYLEMGFDSRIYITMNPVYYLKIAVLVCVVALLSAIYPAWKAIRLNPLEALRKN